MAETKTRSTTRKSGTTTRRSSTARKSTARSTRSTNASTPATKSTTTACRQASSTKRSTTSKRATASRANARTEARAKKALQGPKNRVEQVQEFAERVVNVQVGAALVARDRVVGTVSTVTETLGSRPNVEKQLKKYERRGNTARTRAQKELRERRQRIERTLKRQERRIERDIDAARKDVRRDGKSLSRNITANLDLVTAQVENAVQTGVTTAAKLVADATERVA